MRHLTMGKSGSKLVRDEIPSVEMSPGFQGVCDEAKAVFEQHYNQALAEKSFARNPSALHPRAGIYVKQDARTPAVLIIASKGDRASDIALSEAYTYMSKIVGWRHVQKVHDVQENKSLRWIDLQ